jgi:hypothetical protein
VVVSNVQETFKLISGLVKMDEGECCMDVPRYMSGLSFMYSSTAVKFNLQDMIVISTAAAENWFYITIFVLTL